MNEFEWREGAKIHGASKNWYLYFNGFLLAIVSFNPDFTFSVRINTNNHSLSMNMDGEYKDGFETREDAQLWAEKNVIKNFLLKLVTNPHYNK